MSIVLWNIQTHQLLLGSWKLLCSYVTLHLLGSKSEIPPAVFIARFNELLSTCDGYTWIFTDGSKDGKAVGAAAVLGSRVCVKRLPDHSSIFSAEARAILLWLDMVQHCACNPSRFFVWFAVLFTKSSKSRLGSPAGCQDSLSGTWVCNTWL